MNKEKEKIVLAALLHDIGKFWQRADDSLSKSDHVKDYENSAAVHVPMTREGKPGYQHALWSHKFIMKNQLIFQKCFGGDNINIEAFAKLAANHHKPEDNIAQSIISLADKWAAKNERVFVDLAVEDRETKEHKSWGKYAYKKMPLHSIFDIIYRGEGALSDDKKHVYDFEALRVVGDRISIFTKKLDAIDKSISRQPDYAQLWEAFYKEFQASDQACKSFDQYLSYFQSVVLKYCWCIPSSTIDMPYSNLYEHQKVVAGLSVALWDYYQEKPDDFAHENVPNYGHQLKLVDGCGDPLLMVCIDLSGIQKYIYDIATSSAAKALKGRSFNLQLIMQSVINEVLYYEHIQAYPTQIIYASGGKAYLMLANTNKVKDALKDIKQNLEEKFFEFDRTLYPAIGWVSWRYQINYGEGQYSMQLHSHHDAMRKILEEQRQKAREENEDPKKVNLNLGDLWRAASDEASKVKSKKLLSLISSEHTYAQFFEPEIYHEDDVLCAVTGRQLHRDKTVVNKEGVVMAKEVANQIELGKKLYNFDRITQAYQIELPTDEYSIMRPAGLNNSYKVYTPERAILDRLDVLTLRFNDTSLDGQVHGFSFYGGNRQPLKEDHKSSQWITKSYEDICKDDSGNITKLGVLKMDVDSLGKIFIQGIKDDDKSFSAYATLSFHLEAFFSGYINELRDSEHYDDYIQIIYSGGDDVFAVGRWDKVIHFATDVNEAFHVYTGRNDITLSAGIAIVGHKFPIAKAADLADEAEKASKNFTLPKDGQEYKKNAITFFGETVNWAYEFSLVQEYKDQFLKYEKSISRGFLHKLQQYKLYKDKMLEEKKKDYSYKWHAAYTVARIVEPLKKNKEKNKEVITFFNQISQKMMHHKDMSTDRYLDLVALAARWTEYLLKIKKKEE